MNPAAAARTVQLVGAGVFIVGVLVFVQGKKMYEKTLG